MAKARQLTWGKRMEQASAREKTVGARSNGFLYAVNDFIAQQLSYVSALISVNKYHPTR